MKLREWFRVSNLAADADAADLYIFDVIGKSWWDDEAVHQAKFLADVRALPESVKTIRLHISSPGGNPFDAVTIANTLRNESRERGRRIEVSIEGLAASAATVIAMAGDVIRMADNALFMIHEASGFAFGPKSELLKAADMLESIDRTIVATYRWQSKLDEAAIASLMSATTWMDAATAKENGFVTETFSGMPVAALFRPEALKPLGTIPEAHRPVVEALVVKPEPPAAPPAPPAAADAKAVLAECRQAGVPELAEELLGRPLEEVRAQVAAAKEIRSACQAANFESLAAGYVRANAPLAVVKAHLLDLKARRDKGEIDSHLHPDDKPKPVIDIAESYAALNQRAAGVGRS